MEPKGFRPYGPYQDEFADQLVAKLDRAIPPEDLAILESLGPGAKLNGGTIRYMGIPLGRVTSFNNTRKNEQEILDWIERARFVQ